MTSANTMSISKTPDTPDAIGIHALRKWGLSAAAVFVRLKTVAPYALIELVLPGGSMVALLLWFYRQGKSGAGFGALPVKMSAFLRSANPPVKTRVCAARSAVGSMTGVEQLDS
jgi:hypothetical protein